MKTFLLGILAGVSIGVGSFLYLFVGSLVCKELGALLFSVGLITVCLCSFFLYTGKIGFLLKENNKFGFAVKLLIGLIGNAIGAIGLGLLLRLAFQDSSKVVSFANDVVNKRIIGINSDVIWYRTLVSSIGCGTLVHLAVKAYKMKAPLFLRLVCICLCVFTFVYLGFEHCVANMFYFAFGKSFNGGIALNILITVLGNSIGALMLESMFILSRK